MIGLDIVAWIILPLTLALIGGLIAGIRYLVRFTTFLVRSEEAQASIAESNKEISVRLGQFVDKTDGRLRDHEQRIIVVEVLTNARKVHRDE